MLFGQPPFSVVFQELMLWIKQCVEEARKSDAAYHPGKVLQIQYHSQNVIFTFIHQYWLLTMALDLISPS